MEKFLGLPEVASANGANVDHLIGYVHWLMLFLFVGWLAFFLYSLFRFSSKRNPRGDYKGVTSHVSSYLEVAVAGVEVVLLLFVALPLWKNQVGVNNYPKESESTVVQIVAQQFAWNARYGGKDNIFGKQDMHLVTAENVFGVDPADGNGKDDIQVLNEIHVPVNKPVIAYISSKDVIHSFRVIAMRATQDAIPGMRIPLHFTPIKTGRYQINCAQLCGNGHASMSVGFLVVESQADFDKWVASKSQGNSATTFE